MSNQTDPIIKIDMPLSALRVLQNTLTLALAGTLESEPDFPVLEQLSRDVDRVYLENARAGKIWFEATENVEIDIKPMWFAINQNPES